MPRFRRPRSPVHLARRVAAALLASVALAMALRAPPVPASARAPDVVAVAVAAHDLPAGAVLTAADVAVASYPPDAIPAGVVTDPDQLLRRVLAGCVRWCGQDVHPVAGAHQRRDGDIGQPDRSGDLPNRQ